VLVNCVTVSHGTLEVTVNDSALVVTVKICEVGLSAVSPAPGKSPKCGQTLSWRSGLHSTQCRYHHEPLLGLDQIRSYTSDPQRDTDGFKHGFLSLHVQLTIKGREVPIDRLDALRTLRRSTLDEPRVNNARREFLVAARLKTTHHRVERLADGRTRRVEDPCTLGTAPTTKARLVYPHQLARRRTH
jgi:hypothetical protein